MAACTTQYKQVPDKIVVGNFFNGIEHHPLLAQGCVLCPIIVATPIEKAVILYVISRF